MILDRLDVILVGEADHSENFVKGVNEFRVGSTISEKTKMSDVEENELVKQRWKTYHVGDVGKRIRSR